MAKEHCCSYREHGTLRTRLMCTSAAQTELGSGWGQYSGAEEGMSENDQNACMIICKYQIINNIIKYKKHFFL